MIHIDSPVRRLFVRVLAFASLFVAAAIPLPASANPVSHHWKTLKPMFLALPAKGAVHHAPGALALVQWNGSFTDTLGQTVNYTMVGPDPSAANFTTHIPVVIVPLRMVYGANNGNMAFDPTTTTVQGGRTVVQDLIASPLFKHLLFVQGGTKVGNTQYIDAFQRANFWSLVKTNRDYHVLLGKPKVLPLQTIKVSPLYGQVETNPFGTGQIGTMEVDIFDRKVQKLLAQFSTEITPDTFALFVTDNIYLTEGTGHEVCCIGGYHSALGSQPDGQTYAYATYATEAGVFSQDVSAFSHEIGEWMDDPFVDNSVNCLDNQLMEDGDPLENNADYGDFPYQLNGSTYNLQSLVFIGYFGAPPKTSLHSWLSFQNDESSVCPGQGGTAISLH